MVPNGWSIKTLENLATVERGKFSARPRNDPKYYGGEIPFVQTGDIASAKTYLSSFSQTLNEDGLKVSRIFPKNSILITIAANIGDTAITSFDVACPDSLVGIQPKQDVDCFWLNSFLETRKDDLDGKATQNAQKNINLQVLKPLEILTPPYEEQRKIANILSTWDKAIATTEKLIETSKQQKKALMQQLLTGKKRLVNPETGKAFEGDWRKVELGKLLDYKQPTPYLVKSTEYSNEYPTPVLTAGKTFILGYSDEDFGIFREELPAIIFDDFTTASKFVDFPFKAKSSAMKILIAKDGVSIKYVYEAMQILNYPIGGHQRHWISIFANLVIGLPKPEEQQKIASVLTAADKEIDVFEVKLAHFKQEKKALMQQLLTGKRRVKVAETE
ncbi:restriction endonuclease subunit S [Vibrio genomosp. F10]|uniref:Type I site-specific deoxyribonuclease n=1 Tax=Vibrio genomosp. F10 TaxID=723171 RepID=A0A1B9QYB3_9VIBR|nr:restriction endonuclease subunit S [Vibrio genomosp. F10]OCH75158.1 type I site-specific deoxyribonuclease [Vibrio genomosp. F10]